MAESETGDVQYLPISAVAELLYCPRNFYYRVVEGATDQNGHLLQGRLEEESRDQRRVVMRDGTRQQRGAMLSSERLRLIGVVDVIEERDDIYPVEYKKGEQGDYLHHQVQLCAQAMVMEEVFERQIPRGFLYYGESNARMEVAFTDDLSDLVLHLVE